jgi:hypothetical protein
MLVDYNGMMMVIMMMVVPNDHDIGAGGRRRADK